MSLIGLTVKPVTYDIEMLRGDDQTVRFVITKNDGSVQDVTGWTFKFTVKYSLDDNIAAAKFQKTTGGGGIVLTTPASGIVDVTIAAVDTNALAGPYVYDMQGTDTIGQIKTVRLALFTVRKDVTTTGTAGQASPAALEVVVDPTGILSIYKTVQSAIDYVKPLALIAAPWTIRLTAGKHASDVVINADGLTGVRFVGAGKHQTVIYGTATWVTAASAGGQPPDFFSLASSNDVRFEGLTIDAGVSASGESALALAQALCALGHDTQNGPITAVDCAFYGLVNAVASLASGAATAVFEAYNCSFLGHNGIRAGIETWRMYGCDVAAVRTASTSVQSAGVTALQAGFGGVIQTWLLDGCTFRAEHSGTPAGDVAAFTIGSATGTRVTAVGCMFAVNAPGADPSATATVASFSYASASAGSTDVRLIGCEFIVDTGAYTGVNARVGGVVSRVNLPTSNKLSVVDCDYHDRSGSGGVQRAALVADGGVLTIQLPTTRISGGNFAAASFSAGYAQVSMSAAEAGRITGSATLATGIIRVLLITDAGNVEGAAAMSFDSATATVTGTGTTFLTTMKHGDFVRAASHTDDKWTRVKRVVSNTSLTLEENYRGATLATTQGKRGTVNENTYWAGTVAAPAAYRVAVTPTSTPSATDKFYITAKHASGFVINSLDAASTAVVDWVLTR